MQIIFLTIPQLLNAGQKGCSDFLIALCSSEQLLVACIAPLLAKLYLHRSTNQLKNFSKIPCNTGKSFSYTCKEASKAPAPAEWFLFALVLEFGAIFAVIAKDDVFLLHCLLYRF